MQSQIIGDYSVENGFLSLEVPLDAVTSDGRTALQLAARRGAADVCRDLVAAGADVGLQDRWGVTALHYAARGSRSPTTWHKLRSPLASKGLPVPRSK